jgi:hypothetical protein
VPIVKEADKQISLGIHPNFQSASVCPTPQIITIQDPVLSAWQRVACIFMCPLFEFGHLLPDIRETRYKQHATGQPVSILCQQYEHGCVA